MPKRQRIILSNDTDIEDYANTIRTCLEILNRSNTKPLSQQQIDSMAGILTGVMIGIARQVIYKKDLQVSLEKEILGDGK